MATRAAEARQSTADASKTPAGRRSEGREERSRPQLGVVDRRHLKERAERRQVRALVALSGVAIAAALVVVAGGRAMLASEQTKADSLAGQLAAAVTTQQDLQAQRAQLQSPGRILVIARQELKMVTPSKVTYLTPVNPGESVRQAESPPAAKPSRGASSTQHRTTRRAGA